MTNNTKKIVLVEDEKMIGSAYKIALTRAGYEVVWAEDGQEGMSLIKKIKPDLILLDIILPIMDGFEVLQNIKKDKELVNIPVLILSNLGQDSDVEKGIELGANAYLIKMNNDTTEILEKVKQFIK